MLGWVVELLVLELGSGFRMVGVLGGWTGGRASGRGASRCGASGEASSAANGETPKRNVYKHVFPSGAVTDKPIFDAYLHTWRFVLSSSIGAFVER